VPWFRLDDSFHSHPKVIAAGNEAIGLYVRCGTYAAEHLTNGFIPEDIAVLYGASNTGSRRNPGTGKPETLAETLVRTKLWLRARAGWRMRDYLDYNPSKQAVDKERKAAAERQRRRRDTLSSRRDSRSDTAVSHTTPTRPDPYMAERSHQRAGPGYPQAQRPPFSDNSNGAASRHPSARPVADAIAEAMRREQ
jgi:hypothetical protein